MISHVYLTSVSMTSVTRLPCDMVGYDFRQLNSGTTYLSTTLYWVGFCCLKVFEIQFGKQLLVHCLRVCNGTGKLVPISLCTF